MKIAAAVSGMGLVLALTTACGSSGGGAPATSAASTGSASSAPAVKSAEAASQSDDASSSQPTGGSAGSPVVNAPGRVFSVVLPSGWTQDKQEAQALHAVDVYVGPVTTAFAANVNVVTESSQGLSLEAYRQRSVANLQSALKISGLTAATSTTVAGDDALEYSFQDTQQGRRLMQRQTVVLHGGNAYTITYTATTGAFAASSSAAQSIIASWRWGG
ncbi:DcrB-related protein [uncultured Jatrophihabitans sp.]|uniref:DcrB-related protein n=1 Tax=uncultured Jatrophihabitans sp. TaxID=1610747 RepID=UPI0035CBD387